MKKLPANPVVAVVGATGAVGRVMLSILEQRNFPLSELRVIATPRSAGTEIPFRSENLVVTAIDEDSFEGVDLVLLDTPDEAAKQWAPVAVKKGALVVDNSAAWRMDDQVPLVIPEINASAIERHNGIIASPNCTTIAAIVPADVLHKRFGMKKMVISSYQAVSGAGQPGVDELREQVSKIGDELDLLGSGVYRGPAPSAFAAPIAFNVVPLVGSERESGFTGEEIKLREESRKIMGVPGLQITGTCVRVPTVAGHGVSVYAEFETEITVEGAKEALSASPAIELSDVPNPLLSAGKDECFVGRIRQEEGETHHLWFFSAADNLRKGAALNAVQIAELLLP